MKRIMIILICSYFAFLLGGCQINDESTDIADEELSISHYSDITNRHFEELSSGYMAAFFTKDEISLERITNWLDSRLSNEGFYLFIDSDPASWDMYIYYSPEDGFFDYYSFRFSIVDSTVNIYVIIDDASPTFLSDYMLIRVQAPRRGSGPWPHSGTLYINGIEIERQ